MLIITRNYTEHVSAGWTEDGEFVLANCGQDGAMPKHLLKPYHEAWPGLVARLGICEIVSPCAQGDDVLASFRMTRDEKSP